MFEIKNLSLLNLDPISLSLEARECLVVRGASGTGKTVFLKGVVDLIPAMGQVWLDGESRNEMNTAQWRRRVTYLPAEPGWWAETGLDHFRDLDFGRIHAGKLGLDENILGQKIETLSTGQKQRLSFLLALENNPDILLLDEPTSALDDKNAAIVVDMVKDLKTQGKIILISTHDDELGQKLADKTLTLHEEQGRVAASLN